ncbi:testis-specific zinc finger protein topi-like [Ochlerotatus camptorhynchus]|uniref:testis-specific zinc finger protein topi-like n=1 Tax=Ochlerotatus camptorhynchus TaxID=644619 RepID=UPI0031D740B7
MAPGTEDKSDQLIAENSSPRRDSAEQQSEVDGAGKGGQAAAHCQIKCANCDGIFSPVNFDEHVCEYDERKKRIEPGNVLDGHPCFRQIEQNMEQWKKLTKKKSRVTGGDADETKDKKKSKGLIEKERHRCGHCERMFVHVSGLEKHRAKVHPEMVGQKEKEKDKDPTESFKVCLKCAKCGMIFGSLDKMMEHLEMVDWEWELEQEDGSYMENGKVCLRKAFRIVILTSVYQCEFCDKHFSDFPSLYQHESLHDPISGYECTLCEIRIPCVKDMLFHRLNECVFRDAWNDEFRNLPKYFACNVCDDQFESLGALYEHRYGNYHLFPRPSKMEENESCDQLKVGCEVCGTSFDNADSIISHYTDVHCKKKQSNFGIRRQPTEKRDSTTTTTSPPCCSTRPYLCELCGKTYTQSSHLWQHLRFHNGIRPFTCPEAGCNRSFTIRPDLKDHIRKCHTGERPYHCTLCDKRFLTGSVYYQHRLIHRGERRYGCEECGKRFYRADALKNHQRIHSGEKPFACHHCPKQFRQRGDREKHIRVKHSGPSEKQESSLAYQGTPLTSRTRSKRQQQQRRGGPKRLSQQVEPPEEPAVVEQVIDGSQVIYVGEVSLPASLFQPIMNDIDML